MSVHRLASQQSRIVTSLTKQQQRLVASNVLQIQPGWLYQVELDHAQESLDSGIDPSVIALNVEILTDTATTSYADWLFPIAKRLKVECRENGCRLFAGSCV